MMMAQLSSKFSSIADQERRKGFAFLILSVLIVVFLIFLNQLTGKGAHPPRRVKVTNQTASSLSISWITDQKIEASLVVNGLGEMEDEIQGPSLLHHVTVGNLSPHTTYVYQIKNGGRKYTKNAEGQALSAAQTLPFLPELTNPHPIFGQVKLANEKTPAYPALVYLKVDDPDPAPGSLLLSTAVRANGFWLLDLGNLRNAQGRAFEFDENDVELIQVEAGSLGSGEYQIQVGQDQPTIPLVVK